MAREQESLRSRWTQEMVEALTQALDEHDRPFRLGGEKGPARPLDLASVLRRFGLDDGDARGIPVPIALAHAELVNIDMSYAHAIHLGQLAKSRLENVSLDYAVLETTINGTLFEKCSMRKVSFRGATMVNSSFADCDLTSSSLAGTNITRCRFERCVLANVKPSKTTYCFESIFDNCIWSGFGAAPFQFHRCVFQGTRPSDEVLALATRPNSNNRFEP